MNRYPKFQLGKKVITVNRYPKSQLGIKVITVIRYPSSQSGINESNSELLLTFLK